MSELFQGIDKEFIYESDCILSEIDELLPPGYMVTLIVRDMVNDNHLVTTNDNLDKVAEVIVWASKTGPREELP